jgi:hypothetical protein
MSNEKEWYVQRVDGKSNAMREWPGRIGVRNDLFMAGGAEHTSTDRPTRNWPQDRCNHGGGWGSLGRLGGYQLTKATPICTGPASLCCAHTCAFWHPQNALLPCPVHTEVKKAPVCALIPTLTRQLAARRLVARRRVYFNPSSTLNFSAGNGHHAS